jgi:sec-independent protein translocase protein TatB
MFDIGSPELLLVAVVAIVVIGPKDLPKAMRVVGYWVGKARGTMRQFRAGFDAMVREAELAEMEKKWAEENKRIMAEHPPSEAAQPALPAPAEPEGDPEPAPVMTEKPVIHDEPELPLAPAPESRAP